MFQFKAECGAFANAMRKVAMAIPPSKKSGENDCIQIAMYKEVMQGKGGMAVFVAFDGKAQSISTMPIYEVTSDKEADNVYISGKQLLAAASAFATVDGVLQFSVDTDFSITGIGSKVSLKLGQKVTCLKSTDKIFYEIEMPTEEFVQYMTFASSCFGNEKGIHQMNCVGVKLNIQEHTMVAVSSNGHRCAYAEISNFEVLQKKNKNDSSEVKEEGKDIPPKSIMVTVEGKLLKNAIQNLTGKKKVIIGFEEKRFRIKCGSDVIILLTQDSLFPMDSLIKVIKSSKTVGTWKTQTAKIHQALSILEITMETPWLEISKKDDSSVVLRGKDDNTNAQVLCAQEGEVQKIVMDEVNFKNALSVFSKDKDIYIETEAPDRPLIMKQNLEDLNRIIVMPIASEAK